MNKYASCVVVGCPHTPWGATQEYLDTMLKSMGWYQTSVGWICPEHLRQAKAFGEIATGKVNISA